MAIILAAPIGAGKSTVSKILGEKLNFPVMYESVSDNPVLPLYYGDRKRYGFHLQMYFLQQRVDDMKTAYEHEDLIGGTKHVVSDRSIIEDISIFAKQLYDTKMLNDVEYDIYKKNVTTDLDLLQKIKETTDGTSKDLLIFLKPSFERTLEQIKKRGRPFEQYDNNPELVEYYKDIYSRYENWYKDYNLSPKVMFEDYDMSTEAGQDKFLTELDKKALAIGFNIKGDGI